MPRARRGVGEWAYAGMFFNMTGAAASHLALGDPAVTLVASIIFTGLLTASRALRPLARRDDFASSASRPEAAPSPAGSAPGSSPLSVQWEE